jgi:probable LLM family oxidoreductase
MPAKWELGLDTFGDVTAGDDGAARSQAGVVRDVVEEGVLADEAGLDFFGVGEHHRADFAVSSPEMVLSAIAGRTKMISLGSAVTVLSSDDPVRVFQRFSTLNAVSNGRAEVILGRGSFTESFSLFGYDLSQYDTLFEEKLGLFSQLVGQQPVTWQGTTRPSLNEQNVYPSTEEGGFKVWVGVGGSPESVIRAVRYRMPLMLAIIGGSPQRFVPYADLYRSASKEAGIVDAPVGVHSPGYVADTDEQAQQEFWQPYKAMRDKIGRERGWLPMQRDEFEREVSLGSLYVGSPTTVATKIASTMKSLGAERFDLKYSAGPLPHRNMMRCIELYGTKVAPMVRELLSR